MMQGNRSSLSEAVRADIQQCRDGKIHWLTAIVLTLVFGATAIGLSLFSDAFDAEMTLTGFVELLTLNAAWLFFSLLALVGLFIAFGPSASLAGGNRYHNPVPGILGVLVSRWMLVGGSVLIAFVIPFIVGLTMFDSFSIGVFLGVVILTVLVICAYASVGVALAAVAKSDTRLVLWLLSVYWVVVFLWETSILPLLVAFATGADPETALGTPPLIHDLLLAASPGGAHAALSETLLHGGFGSVKLVAVLALVGWLVLPPVLALYWRGLQRKYRY